jgi:hypothetical protein
MLEKIKSNLIKCCNILLWNFFFLKPPQNMSCLKNLARNKNGYNVTECF